MSVAVGVAVVPGRGHHPDFDGRVHRPHRRHVGRRPHGISVRIMRGKIVVVFPTAITFIANLPVFVVAMVGDVVEADLARRHVAVAAAVIDGDEGLGARPRDWWRCD